MAKKAAAKQRARTPRATKKKTKKKAKKARPARAEAGPPPAPDGGWGERRVPMLLAEHHLRVLEELGRQFGCVSPRGDVVLERVVREVLDRFGSVLLTVAQPKRAVDEEE